MARWSLWHTPLYSTSITTSHFVVHPFMLMTAPLGSSPFAPQCSFIFPHTSHGDATSSILFLFPFGHSHFLCPSSPHLKHCLLFSTTSCHLTSFTPHCITLLVNASNLLLIFFIFSSSFPPLLLQFLTKWPNNLQFQHLCPSLPSNSHLSLVSACLCLSRLLMVWVYTSRDMVLCLRKGKNFGCVEKKNILLWVLLTSVSLADYFTNDLCLLGCKSFPSQVPTALLATVLILGLHYYFSEKIPTLIAFLRMWQCSFTCTSHNGPAAQGW